MPLWLLIWYRCYKSNLKICYSCGMPGHWQPLGGKPSQEIQIYESDPDESDDGALDDLLKGPGQAHWRALLT